MQQADIDLRFDTHTPDEEVMLSMRSVRLTTKSLAEHYNELLPEGRDKALAFTKLEEALFHATASLARQ